MSVIPKKVSSPAFLAAALFFWAAPVFSQDASTAPARPQGSLRLNLVTDTEGSRMGLDYSLRWDFRDLAGINPFSLKGYGRLNPFSGWNIYDNTRWRFYGVSVNPWRAVVSRRRPDISGGSPAADGGAAGGNGNGKREEGRRVWKLSLSPLLDDLRENLDEDLRRALLDAALDPVSGDWGAVPREGKKAFMRDVLSLQVWELPLLGQPKKGITYIAE
ncbi:MAG: hypothetical protein FD189_1156 [Elusimicrobia bacterium]|nr:MAG: hypothetical protein FD154_863 [Elusimicrobiota bacterium]KAF0156112.1 MAG: hypothetical protein FD189_1156 [Elusimicrobiota bacterium]